MGVLALDDRDATIVYSTGWSQAGVSEEFNTTTTFTNTVGATAKVSFFGTKISVRGTIAGILTRKPTSSYTIDTGTATTFEGDPGLTAKFNQLFFESPDLPAGQHTLTITNTGEDANLFIDLLMVTPLDTPMITTVTTTATPPAVTSARTVTVTKSASDSPAGTAAGSVESSPSGAAQKSSNTGAIVGGIIGTLVLLILLVGGFLFYRKRQRQMRADNSAAYDWNAKSSAPSPPTPPLAPQFQSWGQPQMAQATGGSAGYGSYEPWQYPNSAQSGGYPAPPRQYVPPSSYTPQANPLPPLPVRQSSELAYDISEAYGGYEQQGPYPPPPTKQNVPNPTGRVRVNLDG